AGLSAGHFLSTLGYDVTIFEANVEPGGMLVRAIPEFRLDRTPQGDFGRMYARLLRILRKLSRGGRRLGVGYRFAYVYKRKIRGRRRVRL
ncbi:MAG: NAD(P)-binding protein, partial [Clostridia bacterium]|nr:NAD(P)-binding protein [Clostridia bacterium]